MARVTASDAPSNTPPVWTLDSVAKNGQKRTLKLMAKDALSWVVEAEYSIDGGPWKRLEPFAR